MIIMPFFFHTNLFFRLRRRTRFASDGPHAVRNVRLHQIGILRLCDQLASALISARDTESGSTKPYVWQVLFQRASETLVRA